MFPQQPQQQFRKAGADVQIFYGSGAVSTTQHQKSRSKPKGISHIYMMLIGSGSAGDGAVSGASGAVTVWYGAAQNVPDSLVVIAGAVGGAFASAVYARFSSYPALGGTGLLTANPAVSNGGGTAMTANQFTASGFFQSVAGQDADLTTASATTFLSGGISLGNPVLANYGYSTPSGGNGYFQMQPIMIGVGGGINGRGGIGCGGGDNGTGGQGMVLIASW